MEYCSNLWNDAVIKNENGEVFELFLFIDQIELMISFSRQDTINALEILILSLDMFVSFSLIVGICEFGERLSGNFNEINNVYYQFAWYLFPCNTKNMLSTLIMFAQKPVELRVFGSILCGRITLKNVSNEFHFLFHNIKLNQIFYSTFPFIFFFRYSIGHIHGL